MDENTAPDNFLTHSFSLKPNTKEWDELEQQFIDAYNMKNSVSQGNTLQQLACKPHLIKPIYAKCID